MRLPKRPSKLARRFGCILRGGKTLVADMAVHGAGRVPEIDDLDLAAAGVAHTEKGVTVNQYLQSPTNPGVYAAGDAADGGGAPRTPVAGLEGETVAENLLRGNRRTVDFAGLASIVYTIPPLGSAGFTEAQARENGYAVDVKASETTSWFSGRRLAARASAYKTVLESGTGRILGASVFGPHAEELINVFALAIRAGVSAPALRDVLFGYPTAASDLEYMTT
jgi:glutathione reductase (NADPH)